MTKLTIKTNNGDIQIYNDLCAPRHDCLKGSIVQKNYI